jgi:hypothetical protein
MFGPDDTEPFSPNFLAAGYGTRQLVRTMGSLFMIILCSLVLSGIGKMFLYAKFLPAILRSHIADYLDGVYWNGVFSLI